MLLDHIIEQTNNYILNFPKEIRKRYGQFFTSKETAIFMSSLFTLDTDKPQLKVLDPGAGSGILSCAFVERFVRETRVQSIELVCYETDEAILQLLNDNLQFIKDNLAVDFSFKIINENYILSQADSFNNGILSEATNKYDFIIANPPYKKINKQAAEAIALQTVCHGAPNLYFLFASMSLFNLHADGEMVYIMPRSWTSGAYFQKFREFLFNNMVIEHVHLFESRDKVFDKESVLQETLIVKFKKTTVRPEKIIISSTQSNQDFGDLHTVPVPYDLVVSGTNNYVFLATDSKKIGILKRFAKWKNTLLDLGLRMKTGLIVDFRTRDVLRDYYEEGAVPLFYANHIKDGYVEFPITKSGEYVLTERKSLLQKNQNYLFVKRFTSKEEKRRLQCGMYFAKDFPQYDLISTQNKINFIDGVTAISECIIRGLYVLFNSTMYDTYYRILNGSTQVNSTEINCMPVPDIEVIKVLGQKLQETSDLSSENCDRLMEEYCG